MARQPRGSTGIYFWDGLRLVRAARQLDEPLMPPKMLVELVALSERTKPRTSEWLLVPRQREREGATASDVLDLNHTRVTSCRTAA